METYVAIREASAGGLGTAEGQDVAGAPTVTLQAAMRLAAHRDSIASEYTTCFALTFETGLPAVREARAIGLPWHETVVETFLTLLATQPDTLIARKLGAEAAEQVSFRAAAIQKLGGVRSDAGRAAIETFDAELRDPENRRNPGTTADLTCGAIFVALALDGWKPD